MAAVSGSSIVAGRVYGENVGRSVGKNLDLKSADSERSNYQDREVVVRIDDRNCGTTCVASVDREDLDVGADDDRAQSAVTVKVGDAVDADSIASRSPKGACRRPCHWAEPTTMRQRSGRHCTFGQKPRKGWANGIMKMSSRSHVVTTLGQSLRVKPPDLIVRKLRNALREQSWSDSVWRS